MLVESEKKMDETDGPLCPEKGIGAMKAVDIDAFRLADMGYAQDMTRNFSTLSILGISFTLTSSWFGFSVSLVTGLSSGGTVVSVWVIPLMAFISGAVAVTLSELASSMPNAGGQYFWTTQLAPKKYANGLAFLCGWVSWVAAIFTTASSALGLGTLLVGVWQLTHPDFVPQAWHSVVGYLVANLFCSLFNCVGQLLPTIATVSMYISLVSFLVVLITVPATSGSYSDPKFVFATFTNSTGWSSSRLAFLVGLINPNWLFVCLDAATHMAEEVKSPEKIIPKAIMSTVAVGFITSWVFCLVMFFSITDLEALLTTSTGVPILELFYQSLKSRIGAAVLGALILATGFRCQVASQTW
ncbi:Choline transport protein [Penicillium angulare]|uniref:Choline transport protein n=1 Tax=Penicillium angulare TaxID=116970 RepID=UPI002541FF75|nr:Choline transport protein [Penicillium angulare]KAJ5259296.1 Choline transport protein [Penicillium angulare]